MGNVAATIKGYGLDILAAVIILVVGRWVAGLLQNLAGKVMARNKVDETLTNFVVNLVFIAVMTFVVIAALGKLGFQTASFVAIIGAAGLAVGLALQGSLSNFAAGVLLIIFRPFKAGDFIEAGGATGVVESVAIFTTTLKTPDNKTVIVPNSKITGDKITNVTARDTRRVDMTVGVSYDADLGKAKEVFDAVLAADERILKDPEPTVAVAELADSSVNFVVRPWVKTEDYWAVLFDATRAIKEKLDAEGIGIPFPQRDVHLHQETS